MNCPCCDGELDADMMRGQPTATCEACAGVWIAAGGLDEITGAEIEERLRQDWAQEPEICRYCNMPLGFGETCTGCGKLPAVACPSGHGVMKTAWIQLGGMDAEIDQCATCGGLWIDAHERELLQAHDPATPVAIDEFLPVPTRPPRHEFNEPVREIDKFLSALEGAGTYEESLPTLPVARVMLVVVVALFVVVRFFAWDYVERLLNLH